MQSFMKPVSKNFVTKTYKFKLKISILCSIGTLLKRVPKLRIESFFITSKDTYTGLPIFEDFRIR